MKTNTQTHTRRWLTRAVLPVLLVLLAVATAAQVRPAEPMLQGEGTLKVMTYNMYVGTDYNSLANPDFAAGVTQLLVDVRASDPQGRAQAIARQIAMTKPHLVSLQEMAIWASGTAPSTLQTEFDFLQLLLDALAAQGVNYTKAAVLKHFDVIMPTTTGFARNAWRIVILARADLPPEDFSITNVQMAPWSAECTATMIVPFPRGWVSADINYRTKQFRFIGAHLDSSSTSKNICQGKELLAGPADTTLPVVLAGDLNCDLANSSDPKYQTCVRLLDAGFVDSWTAANPYLPGYTKDLPTMTKRGDYVMVRGRFGVQAAVLVGEEPGDMTLSGLWPSNHCGVVTRLQLPGEE